MGRSPWGWSSIARCRFVSRPKSSYPKSSEPAQAIAGEIGPARRRRSNRAPETLRQKDRDGISTSGESRPREGGRRRDNNLRQTNRGGAPRKLMPSAPKGV